MLRILTLRSAKNNVSTSISTSNTTQPGSVIEGYVFPVGINLYHVSKSQDDKGK